jgi:hypothetical protein
MVNKVDVIINVYGKPYQTLVTLKSLMKYSGDYIDKIYLQEEPNQPEIFDINLILNEFDNIIHYKPKYFNFVNQINKERCFTDEEYRLSIRYQYGFEKSDKEYIFITHNDVLYTNNIIKYYQDNIGNNLGVGIIGQCWNCSMFHANKCSGENFNNFNYNYNEIIQTFNTYKPARPHQTININNPFPLPECRLNEHFCLINNKINKRITLIEKKVIPFGTYYNGTDLAVEWFKQSWLLGYRFKNKETLQTSKYAIHAYFTFDKSGCGHTSLSDKEKYTNEENIAKQFLNENY